MEDEKIIALYFDRSESAISETDRKYGGLCFDVANKILNSPSDSEECVSDTYLGVWNAIPPTRPQSFRAFLLKITRNISLSRLRKKLTLKRSYDMEISLNELEEILPDERISPEADDSFIAEVISEFLDGLDRDAKNIFVRKYWFFDTVTEICKRSGFSEAKVKSSLFRTREKLKIYLIKRGVKI